MKKILMSVATLMLVILPMQSHADMHTSKPTLYAIAFHADWCGSCEVLEPQMIKARGKSALDSQNVLFVKLDLTDQMTRHQSGLMASALGIHEFYKTNNGKTGFVLLVNSSNGETLGKITKEMDSNQITTMIQEKIQSL